MRKVGIFLCCLVLVACGGGGSSSGASGGTSGAVEISGTYSGSLSSSVVPVRGTLRVTVNQSGSRISGTFTLSNITGGFTCFSSGSFSGTVSGNNVAFGVATSGGSANFNGTVSVNRLSGTYSVTSGACSGDRGTFSVTK